MDVAHGHGEAGRAELGDAGMEERENSVGGEARGQSQADFGGGLGGNNRLGAFGGEAAAYAVNLEGGTGGLAFAGVVVLLTGEVVHAHLLFHEGDDIHRVAVPEGVLGRREGDDVLIELGDGDAAVGAFEADE